MRIQQGSRVEAFSDAVFAFALTLLVVSLEVPDDFAALRTVMSGFLAFAATFAIICWIWYQHVAYFRRFGSDDPLVISVNCALLFLVLFFVYPLKFTFSGLMGPQGVPSMTAADARWLLSIYSGGFIGVFAVFALLYGYAWRRRTAAALSPIEVFDARAGVRAHLLSVAIGVLALGLTQVVPPERLWVPGLTFTLLGPVHGLNGYLSGRARDRIS